MIQQLNVLETTVMVNPIRQTILFLYNWLLVISTCGLKVDGSITCWGRWDFNQLMYPASYNNSMVFVGGDFSCGVLQSTGRHVCVGYDLSYAYSTLPLIQYDVLSAGYDTICGIRADTKSLVCSGNNEDGRVTLPSGSFITVSVNVACAITTNHTVVCWGKNTHRQTETQSCECPGLCYSHGLCLDNGSCICDNIISILQLHAVSVTLVILVNIAQVFHALARTTPIQMYVPAMESVLT